MNTYAGIISHYIPSGHDYKIYNYKQDKAPSCVRTPSQHASNLKKQRTVYFKIRNLEIGVHQLNWIKSTWCAKKKFGIAAVHITLRSEKGGWTPKPKAQANAPPAVKVMMYKLKWYFGFSFRKTFVLYSVGGRLKDRWVRSADMVVYFFTALGGDLTLFESHALRSISLISGYR